MRIFSREELKQFNGKDKPAYVAYRGKVYDVSGSFQWRNGRHQVVHNAGCDLTAAIEDAPHGPDMLDKFPIVGELLDPE